MQQGFVVSVNSFKGLRGQEPVKPEGGASPMATQVTAAAAFHVTVLQTPEGKYLIKDNHVCICPEGLGVLEFQARYSHL